MPTVGPVDERGDDGSRMTFVFGVSDSAGETGDNVTGNPGGKSSALGGFVVVVVVRG